jgi:hypothetical protein
MLSQRLLPVFILISGITALTTAAVLTYTPPEIQDAARSAYVPVAFRAMAELEAPDFRSAIRKQPDNDLITVLYQNPTTRLAVLDFFTAITHSLEISGIILDAALHHGLAPALVFALVHEESRYHPRAVNRNADSIDRGLFQLNSASFPKLGSNEFFDPATNAYYGAAHLAFCLETGGNVVAALAVYNAGLGRVSKTGTPRTTLDYIHRILAYKANLEMLFEAQVVARPTVAAESS